jgi:hypothetical protein
VYEKLKCIIGALFFLAKFDESGKIFKSSSINNLPDRGLIHPPVAFPNKNLSHYEFPTPIELIRHSIYFLYFPAFYPFYWKI